jgi:hypothetical protein
MMEAIRNLKKQLDDTREEMVKLGRDALTAEFKRIFEEWPEIEGIRWTQYTPYFNDGDPCVFHVNGSYVKIGDEGGDDDDGWKDRYEVGDRDSIEYKRCKEIQDSLDLCEEILPFIFGDHVQVTIWRGKDEAEVEDHDHD